MSLGNLPLQALALTLTITPTSPVIANLPLILSLPLPLPLPLPATRTVSSDMSPGKLPLQTRQHPSVRRVQLDQPAEGAAYLCKR